MDPDIYYDVNWRTGSTNYDGWFKQSTPRGEAAQPFQYFKSAENLPTSQGGLGIFVPASTNYNQGDAGAWARVAPGNPDAPGTIQAGTGRKLSSEHAIWYRFDAGSLAFGYAGTQWYHAYNYLRPRIGFLDQNGVGDTSSHWQEQTGTDPITWGSENSGFVNDLGNATNGASGRIYLTNPDSPDSGAIASKTDNIISLGLVDQVGNGGGWWPDRPTTSLAMGWYRAYTVDAVDPTLTVTGLPTGWVDELPSVHVQSNDNGVGVQRVGLRDDSGTVLSSVNSDCPLNANTVCPWSVDTDLPIPDLGEGIRTGNIVSLDAGGRYKTQNVQLQLDTSAPDLTLAGDLFTQRDTEIGPTETRALTINTADGTPSGGPSEQRSGVSTIDIYIEGELVKTETQTLTGDSRGLNTTWTPTAADLEVGGPLVVTVVATDKLGHEKEANFLIRTPAATNDVEDEDVQDEAAEANAAENGVSLAQAQINVDREDAASQLDDLLIDDLGNDYSGLYVEPSTGRVKISVTAAASDPAVVRDVAQVDLTGYVDKVIRTSSWADLEAGQTAFDNAAASLINAEKVGRAGIEPGRGRLIIDKANSLTSSETSQLDAAISSLSVPTTVETQNVATIESNATACTGPNCDNPIRGGVRIQSEFWSQGGADDIREMCTAGFVARSRSGSKLPFLMTAGHCTDGADAHNANLWYARPANLGSTPDLETDLVDAGNIRWKEIGTASSKGFVNSNGDAGMISIRNSSYWRDNLDGILLVHRAVGGGEARRERYRIVRTVKNKDIRRGVSVCTTGNPVTTGTDVQPQTLCGKIRAVNKPVDYDDLNKTVGHLFQVNFCSTGRETSPGHSGGPVFKKGIAFGLVSGQGGGRPCYTWVFPANRASTELGVQIVTKKRSGS